MNKKLLTLFVIMIVAAATISFVSAANTQTVNGVEFNIPSGYIYSEELSEVASQTYETDPSNIGVFTNIDNVIILIVLDNENGLTLDDINSKNYPVKTIGGKEGYLNTDGNDTFFGYIDGKKAVGISAPDEATIEAVIK